MLLLFYTNICEANDIQYLGFPALGLRGHQDLQVSSELQVRSFEQESQSRH
jgi:hypothetical protein